MPMCVLQPYSTCLHPTHSSLSQETWWKLPVRRRRIYPPITDPSTLPALRLQYLPQNRRTHGQREPWWDRRQPESAEGRRAHQVEAQGHYGCHAMRLIPYPRKYTAIKDRGTPNEERCTSKRSFCSNCSTMLWVWDYHWPELIHPFASAIDTELPAADEMVCIMEGSKPAWARWPEGKKTVHESYSGSSLEEWHKKHELFFEWLYFTILQTWCYVALMMGLNVVLQRSLEIEEWRRKNYDLWRDKNLKNEIEMNIHDLIQDELIGGYQGYLLMNMLAAEHTSNERIIIWVRTDQFSKANIICFYIVYSERTQRILWVHQREKVEKEWHGWTHRDIGWGIYNRWLVPTL